MLQASTKCVCAKTKAVHDSLRHLEAIFLQSQDIHVKDITTAQDHVRNMLRSVLFFTCREGARSSRTVGRKKKKKGLMDFETLKPLFLVVFGLILSCFDLV